MVDFQIRPQRIASRLSSPRPSDLKSGSNLSHSSVGRRPMPPRRISEHQVEELAEHRLQSSRPHLMGCWVEDSVVGVVVRVARLVEAWEWGAIKAARSHLPHLEAITAPPILGDSQHPSECLAGT